MGYMQIIIIFYGMKRIMVIIAVMTSCMSIAAQTQKQNNMVLNKQQQSMDCHCLP